MFTGTTRTVVIFSKLAKEPKMMSKGLADVFSKVQSTQAQELEFLRIYLTLYGANAGTRAATKAGIPKKWAARWAGAMLSHPSTIAAVRAHYARQQAESERLDRLIGCP